jgi:nucleoside-diphosphate-sugar epimerase
MFCQEYASERGLKTYIARFHNVYGPYGAWGGGREKAPAAICRKVALAKLSGKHEIEIWGDGTRTRSFTYIDDCVDGILKIVHSHRLIATPINLGSSEKVSINQLVDIIENIAGIKLNRTYKLDAPQGVSGRSSDNTFIKSILNWEPSTSLQVGLEKTYEWVENEVRKHGDCYSPSR